MQNSRSRSGWIRDLTLIGALASVFLAFETSKPLIEEIWLYGWLFGTLVNLLAIAAIPLLGFFSWRCARREDSRTPIMVLLFWTLLFAAAYAVLIATFTSVQVPEYDIVVSISATDGSLPPRWQVLDAARVFLLLDSPIHFAAIPMWIAVAFLGRAVYVRYRPTSQWGPKWTVRHLVVALAVSHLALAIHESRILVYLCEYVQGAFAIRLEESPYLVGLLGPPFVLMGWAESLFAWPVLPGFLFGAVYIVGRATMSAELTEGGVAIRSFGAKLWSASWSSIRRVVAIEHNRPAHDVIVHARAFGFLPYSFGIHAKHFTDGARLCSSLIEACVQRGIPVERRSSPRWVPAAAWGLLIAGAGLAFWVCDVAYIGGQNYANDYPSPGNVAAMLRPMEQAALFLSAVVMIGCGLGLLSAYHRGTFRPVLAGAWVWVSVQFAEPTHLSFLVSIAINAIHKAMLQPVLPIPDATMPPNGQLELLVTAMEYTPVFAGIAYVIGTMVGSRRMSPGVEKVGVREPLSPAPVQRSAAEEQQFSPVSY